MEWCKSHEAHESRIKKTETDIVSIYELLEKIRNRLPLYATILIAALTAIIGWLLKK